MTRDRAPWIGYVLAAVLGIVLAGCATAPVSSSPKSQDDLLTAAGFTSYVSKTPQSLAYLKTLPPPGDREAQLSRHKPVSGVH